MSICQDPLQLCKVSQPCPSRQVLRPTDQTARTSLNSWLNTSLNGSSHANCEPESDFHPNQN